MVVLVEWNENVIVLPEGPQQRDIVAVLSSSAVSTADEVDVEVLGIEEFAVAAVDRFHVQGP